APRATLFPYTTLFRSRLVGAALGVGVVADGERLGVAGVVGGVRVVAALGAVALRVAVAEVLGLAVSAVAAAGGSRVAAAPRVGRSEEHTSELQSRENL